MAILDLLPGVEVTIMTGPEILQEFDVADHEEEANKTGECQTPIQLHQKSHTVEKFIEARSGQEFKIRLIMKDPYRFETARTGFRIYLDGTLVCCESTHASHYEKIKQQKNGQWTVVVEGPEQLVDDVATVRSIVFSELPATVDENWESKAISKQQEKLSAIGEIKILVYNYDEGVQTSKLINRQLDDAYYDSDIHEKALKGTAKSHGIILGPEKRLESIEVRNCKIVGDIDYPLATFKFKYRSLKSLHALHIPGIPDRPQSPTPPRAETPANIDLRGAEEDNKRELQALLQRMAASDPNGELATLLKVKRERGQDQDSTPRKRPRKGLKVKVTIDLTEDDDDNGEDAVVLEGGTRHIS